jgi:hypothetical protein
VFGSLVLCGLLFPGLWRVLAVAWLLSGWTVIWFRAIVRLRWPMRNWTDLAVFGVTMLPLIGIAIRALWVW